MDRETRRKKICEILEGSEVLVSASALAKRFKVSRQCIVQDIAILRANGVIIEAYARGYQIPKSNHLEKVLKVVHKDDEVEKELNIIVDLGGVVKDVFVFHKVYGKIAAPMDIASRSDVKAFADSIASGKSSLLKNITSNFHYHTIMAPDKKTLELIEDKLWEAGFLAELKEYEPEEINRQKE